jgi:hypothetical protein|tara:strand:+ start:2893 stop:3159 length:267 start_codon:yes stop_codon:yes gene_type:complete
MVLTLAGNVVSGMIMSVIQVGKIAAGPVPIKLFILYLKICLATSIFITFFMLGGFITPLLGIIYIYYVFFKRLKCWSKNIPQDKCDIY